MKSEQDSGIPKDRIGIQQYVRAALPKIASDTAEAIASLPLQTSPRLRQLSSSETSPTLEQQVAEYVKFKERWNTAKAFWNGSFVDFVEYVVGGAVEDRDPSQNWTDWTQTQNRRSEIAEDIDFLSNSLTRLAPFQAQNCSFANLTNANRNLYGAYPAVADVCGFLKCPVIDASGIEFILLTSINPYTAQFAAEVIKEIIFQETKLIPFVSITTSPKRTRDYLCALHFVYES